MSDSSGAFSAFLRSLNEPEQAVEQAVDRPAYDRAERLLINIEQNFDRAMTRALMLYSIMRVSEDEEDIARAQVSAQIDLSEDLRRVHRALGDYAALHNWERDDDLLVLIDRIRDLYSFADNADGDTISPDRLREFREHINAAREAFVHFMSKQQLNPNG